MSNTHLFKYNTNFKDNEVISIGTLLLIINPDLVENVLNRIPIVTTKERVVALKIMNYNEILISNNLDGNSSRGLYAMELKL